MKGGKPMEAISNVKLDGVIKYFRTKNISFGQLALKMKMPRNTIYAKLSGRRTMFVDEWEQLKRMYPSLSYYEEK